VETIDMSERLKGKVAVVTGAGRGIGRAEALALAAAGAKVVVNDVGSELDGIGTSNFPADKVVQEINLSGGEAVADYNSVAVAEGGENIIQTAIDNYGRIDILVNNAGILRNRMIYNMDNEEWDSVLKVHLYGHFYCTRAACSYFKKQQSGCIVNTSSSAGLGVAGEVNYSAAKEGIVGFTRNVARDMSKYGVTCNAIRPAAQTRMISPQIKAALTNMHDQNIKDTVISFESLIPEKVAPFVVFLATDVAKAITGCTFSVYGGTIGIYSEPVIKSSIYKDGIWTLDELVQLIPELLTNDVTGAINRAV
jgi:NAD(P)-dependent dehydrogenase (short-subunit alcohol dehydrogenase family)